MKTLTKSGDFTGSRIRISNSGGTSKGFGNLNSAFEKAQLIICLWFRKVIPKPAPNFFLIFHHLRLTEHPFYKIIGGFLDAATLTFLEILQEAASEFPCLAAPQRELETSIQPLKKPSQSSVCDFWKVIPKSASKVFEFFTIIAGLWNNLQNHRRLPECDKDLHKKYV
jgi:hypothetical protein